MSKVLETPLTTFKCPDERLPTGVICRQDKEFSRDLEGARVAAVPGRL
jgi:hypothetical protein